MASYTINGKEYKSFEEFIQTADDRTRGLLLANTRRYDKFVDDSNVDIMKAAYLIKNHKSNNASNYRFILTSCVCEGLLMDIICMYIHKYIDTLYSDEVAQEKGISPGLLVPDYDFDWRGDPLKEKPYSEYTTYEKGLCIKRLIDNGYTKRLKSDKSAEVRLDVYNTIGWDEMAKHDSSPQVRLRAYESLGWDEDAKSDEDFDIRYSAYCALGWTKEALDDEYTDIRIHAQKYYNITGKRADE